MVGTRGTWTAERIERLKSCFDAGLSCAEIASEIGVTRNAVIGKISRLNLSRLKRVAAGQPERKGTPRIRRPRFMTQRGILMTIRPAAEELPVDSGQRCSLLELGEEKCRWPISDPGAEDFCFCGNKPVGGLPYCAAHARMAYRGGRSTARSCGDTVPVKVDGGHAVSMPAVGIRIRNAS